MAIAENTLRRIYRSMVEIRYFEEEAIRTWRKRMWEGSLHVCIAQEAPAAAMCAALQPDDYFSSNHRGHGHYIAKGLDPGKCLAEMFGRTTGYSRGRGGSMHMVSVEHRIFGNSMVGSGAHIAAGIGLAVKRQGTGEVVACSFGEGATNTGGWHEGINFAATHKLPVVFLCENNNIAVWTRYSETFAVENISSRAAGYGMPGCTVDGTDAIATYETCAEAVDRARRGDGPTLIEAKCYRWRGHTVWDPATHRSEEENEEWAQHDPIPRLEEHLVSQGIMTPEEIEALKTEVRGVMNAAGEFAQGSPEPELTRAEAVKYNYLDEPGLTRPPAEAGEPPPAEGERITFAQALADALAEEMARDDRVFVIGEDVGRQGGAFKQTEGLRERFGDERVIAAPISEAAIQGVGVGAAFAGMRPVVEQQYIDFLAYVDPLVNQVAKFRFVSGGQVRLPLVTRLPNGCKGGNSATHSQSLEAWFMHVPGLLVAYPSTPYDAKGLLKTAIRGNNPVVFIEDIGGYFARGPVPDEEYTLPFGVADIKREGSDITIVALGHMVSRALQAADVLAGEGIDAEVVDPRTLNPLDIDTIVESVKKTGYLVTLHQAWRTCGVGAEIAAQVMELAFDYLDGPVERVAGLDTSAPYYTKLEELAYPCADDVVAAVRKALNRP